ncbi:cupin domain-containing protein [Longimicrobium sp.]|jgi:quercetin dioxygenase-like cupin family protein|uniref:cupin domain-containing protein n=1 Tax=Longimicrobium sp. TaxID=2029185 RepID=UPI002F9428FB
MPVPRSLPLFLVLAACAPSAPAADPTPAARPPATPRVLTVSDAQAPAAGTVATSVLHESPTSVSRIMRLAPGAQIPEHHHPAHDETFFVHQGTVTAVLNGQEHTVRAGGLVHIPAGTVIVGRNPGSEEAVVVVVFSSNGTGGPLTVAGRPHH